MPAINVDDHGADPTGAEGSADAFRAALALAPGNGVEASGVYKLSGLIVFGTAHEVMRDLDPTGAVDCTAAFRVGLSTMAGRAVMMPPGAGTYKLDGLIIGAEGLSS